MGPIYSLADVLDMLRRRALLIIAIVVLGCVLSLFWAKSFAQVYRSSEVIQIEQPKISNDLARSTVEGSSARRLQLIEQQLMARSNLNKMIEELGLYDNLPGLQMSEKVDLLRRSVSITGVAAVRDGFGDDGAIAVQTITVEMDNAADAQLVAHEFANRTRALAASQRENQTRETLEFFQRQEQHLLRDMAALEAELIRFRNENDLSIEGNLEFRRDEIGNLNESILSLDRELIAAQLARGRIDRTARASTVAREEADFDAQIETLSTQRGLLQDRRATLTASIQTTPEVESELAGFQRRMAQLQGQLDIISTRRNEAEVGFSLESANRGERLTTLEEALLPEYPISMSRKKRATMGAAASVMLALGIAFLLELRHPVVRTARQMERETGLVPVITIPDLRGRKVKARLKLTGLQHKRRIAGKQGRDARLSRSGET